MTSINAGAVSPGLATETGAGAGTFDRDWAAVAGCCIGLIFSIGTLTVYTFGVFVHPLAGEFGWSRTELAAALSISQLAFAVASPIWGGFTDRFGQRTVLMISVVMLSLLVASLSVLTANIWHFYLVFGALAFFAGAAGPMGYSAVLIERFDKRLGLALGFALMGVGLGAAILPPITQAFVAHVGWRGAYLALGILTFVVTFPAALLATRRTSRPAAATAKSASVPVTASPLAIASMVWSRPMLLMCVSFLFLGLVTVGTIAHFVPMLTDQGVSAADAAWISSLVGLLVIVARGGIGWVLDRVHAPYVLMVVALFAVAAFLLLAYGQQASTFYIAAILLGAVLGSEVDFISFLTRRYFDPAAFGRLYGVAFASFMVGAAAGPVAMGICYGRFGSYEPGLLVFAALSLAIVFLALLMPRYASPRKMASTG